MKALVANAVELKACARCGGIYGRNGRSPSNWQRSQYCSRLCQVKAISVRHWAGHRGEFRCLSCGKVETTNAFRAAKRKYCSRECARRSPVRLQAAIKNLPRGLVGPAHPRWRGGHLYGRDWPEIRRRALEKAGGKCERCGRVAKKLDVHHVIPWRIVQATRDQDLLVLCARCHAALERSLDRLIRQVTANFMRERR